MKFKGLLAAVAVVTTAGLLISLGFSRAMTQGAMTQDKTVAIAGNHPDITLTGWKPAPGDLELHMTAVLALRNPRELTELKTQLQQPGSPNYPSGSAPRNSCAVSVRRRSR